MTDKVFLDTNIIVYSFDRSDTGKNKKAKKLLDRLFINSECKISTQVIQEFCSVAFRKMKPPLAEREVKEFISTISESNIETIDVHTIIKALDIKSEYSLSFWDSLVVSTALLSECSILYSEDMQDGFVIDALTIKNPFSGRE